MKEYIKQRDNPNFQSKYIHDGHFWTIDGVNWHPVPKPVFHTTKDKLKGQRLGQALWNALDDTVTKDAVNGIDANAAIGLTLFYIEDEDLRKLLNDYLREL